MTDRIAVVGAGQMGSGIAHVFAQSGFNVTMIDVSQQALGAGQADALAASADECMLAGQVEVHGDLQ